MPAKNAGAVVSDADIAALGTFEPKPPSLFVAKRAFTFADRTFAVGEEFEHPEADSRKIRRMIDSGLLKDPVEVALAVRRSA